MKLDILFIDVACSKPYNLDSLENDSLGGTEGSTIRLAEGFAKKGHKTAVIQHFDFSPTVSENGVHYLPQHYIDIVTAKNVIHLRYRGNLHKFPKSKQFIWMHDACKPDHNNHSDWPEFLKPYNVQCIAVSDWHIENIHSLAPTLNVKRIYSPVDETCYTYPRKPYDKNQLVWMSSPHKGLDMALEIFKEMQLKTPELKLVVFNPGYWFEKEKNYRNVIYLPKCSKAIMRSIVSQSLCLFYPTRFEETFGLVAAECNAMGTPVACYPIAALQESCNNEFSEDSENLKSRVLAWRESRPVVIGQERFKFETIYKDWVKLLRK